jgi:sulfotransferase
MQIFYQSSMPRSGSTLLQNLLAQNPAIYSTPTSGVLELIYSSRLCFSNSLEFRAQDSELMQKGFVNFCRHGMYGFYGAITDKPYVVDKSRGWGIHYDLLNLIQPDPKIICMVRDLGCVLTSMELNFRKNPVGHNLAINHAELTNTTTEKRVATWLKQPPIGIALERISQMILQGIDKKICFVRYEDLCRRPEEQMRKIYAYLQIPKHEHDFENIQQLTKEDDAIYGVFGNHEIKPKLAMVPDRQVEVLGANLVNAVKQAFNWYYSYFGYSF